MSPSDDAIEALRREIDEIDDAILDLILRRTAVVERIGAQKAEGGRPTLRPGREAAVLRRLLARHRGRFPRAALVRIWRELISASVNLQAPLVVAVCGSEHASGYEGIARAHFGSAARLVFRPTVEETIRAVAEDAAVVVGVLPAPGRGADWWPALMADGGAAPPRIVAALPIVAGGSGGDGPGPSAVAIARIPPEASGDDRSYVGLEIDPDMPPDELDAALATAELEPVGAVSALPPGEGGALVLVEVEGFVAADDPRLDRLVDGPDPRVRRAVALGSFAAPFAVDGPPPDAGTECEEDDR